MEKADGPPCISARSQAVPAGRPDRAARYPRTSSELPTLSARPTLPGVGRMDLR